MRGRFTKNISPHVQKELALARERRSYDDHRVEFKHLENAHILGQESTYWHVKVHTLMLFWAVRNKAPKEFSGQLLRIIAAGILTVFGLIPKGNTGGSNVNPLKVMPISEQQEAIIRAAKEQV